MLRKEEPRQMSAQKIICIGCPLGCRGKVIVDDNGEALEFEGYGCKEGEEYAGVEVKSPVRTLTGTVIVESEIRPLLPVRTNKPISKEKLKECMKILARVRAKPPIKLGEVIVPNILHTTADILAAADLPR